MNFSLSCNVSCGEDKRPLSENISQRLKKIAGSIGPARFFATRMQPTHMCSPGNNAPRGERDISTGFSSSQRELVVHFPPPNFRSSVRRAERVSNEGKEGRRSWVAGEHRDAIGGADSRLANLG